MHRGKTLRRHAEGKSGMYEGGILKTDAASRNTGPFASVLRVHEYSGPVPLSENPVSARKMATWQMRRPFRSTIRRARWSPQRSYKGGIW